MELHSKIYVAGHRGMVGSAIVANLEKRGFTNIISRTSSELDLTNQTAVAEFFATEKPEFVFLAAAKSRRNRCQQHLQSRFYIRKYDDSEQCDSSQLCKRCEKVNVFGFFLYLSEAGTATVKRRVPVNRFAGRNQ